MWKSMQIYYYEDDKQALLLDGIRPVIQRMQQKGDIIRVYVQRHWRFGPHIAVNVEFDDAHNVEETLQQLKEGIEAYLFKYPSERKLDEQAYLELCEQWRNGIADNEPYSPMRPDNQITIEEHPVMPGMWRHPLLSELLESFYAYTYELVLHVIERTRSNRQARYIQLVRMMAAAGQMFPSRGLYDSYRIYQCVADQYVNQWEQKEFAMKQFQEVSLQWGSLFDQAVQEVVHGSIQDGLYQGQDELLRRWSTALKELYSAVKKLTEEGLIESEEVEALWLEHMNMLSSKSVEQACVQRLISTSNGQRQGGTAPNPALTAYLCATSVVDGLFPLFHISLHVKHMLTYMLASSAERIFHVYNQHPFADINLGADPELSQVKSIN